MQASVPPATMGKNAESKLYVGYRSFEYNVFCPGHDWLMLLRVGGLEFQLWAGEQPLPPAVAI